MKNYNRRNFWELLKYTAFAHVATAMLYIALLSSAEEGYVTGGRVEQFNTILFIVSLVSFAVSAVVMLAAHYGNSEKKMNYLNATYEGGNENRVALITALKESATAAAANLLFQLPFIFFFMNYGYGYHEALIFETLYIGDIGVYIFLGSAPVGALLIALAWFAVYFLGVFLFVAPIWNMGRIRKKGGPVKPEENPKDAYYRHTFKNTFKIFYALRKFAISTLITFGIFIVCSIFFAALAKEMSTEASHILYGVFYAIVFYKVHGYRRDSSYYPHEKKFSFAKEARAVFSEELRHYLLIFVPLAVIGEVSCFIFTGQNFVTLVLMFVFPFYGVIPVPVLRSAVNVLWASAVMLFCAVIKSAKQHRKVSRASRYRR